MLPLTIIVFVLYRLTCHFTWINYIFSLKYKAMFLYVIFLFYSTCHLVHQIIASMLSSFLLQKRLEEEAALKKAEEEEVR